MGGTMNTIVRPWRDEWQLWRSPKKAVGLVLEQSGPLETLRTPESSCCAIPARMVVSVPFWVEASDVDAAREIALLEVEMKGLASGERLGTDVEISILKSDEGRAMVRADIYPADWPGSLAALKGSRFLPSPMLATLGVDAVHLWRELDDLVAVVVWDGQVVCWETTHWPNETAAVASWLQCLMIQLEDELKLPEPFQLKEWFGIFAEVPQMFKRVAFFGDADCDKGPSPKPEAPPGRWLPAAARRLRIDRQQRSRTMRIAGLVLAVLAVAGATLVALNLRLDWQLREVDREIVRLEAEVEPSYRIASRWNDLEVAVDERFHPLEILRDIVGAISPTGVRLTVFQMSVDRVLVEGEAENVSAATAFFRAVQADSKSGLHWEMAAPALQPNNTARFAITGVRETDGQ